MKIDLQDCNGQLFTITSRNADTIGRWFAEHARMLMSADSRYESQIRIWPQDRDEMKLIGQDVFAKLTQEGLLMLAEVVLKAAERAGELEAARA